jgi:non-canonical (house-cleaning) NTP pyrophosphatase
MQSDLRDFWQRLQTGVEVAVAGSSPEILLGVRDGFRRYLDNGAGSGVPVVVVPHEAEATEVPLRLSDKAIIRHVSQEVDRLRSVAGEQYHFLVAADGGTHDLSLEDGTHVFVRCWAMLWSTVGEALGSSGSVEIPQRLIANLEESEGMRHLPGTRRQGGLIRSLTGGLETRRSAVAQATLHALSSLFYGVIESRPMRWNR